jgi:hypothetical protein
VRYTPAATLQFPYLKLHQFVYQHSGGLIGSPGSLTGQTVDIPESAQDELLVRVRATALTARELGWPETWPAIPA